MAKAYGALTNDPEQNNTTKLEARGKSNEKRKQQNRKV